MPHAYTQGYVRADPWNSGDHACARVSVGPSFLAYFLHLFAYFRVFLGAKLDFF
jgi:hypothetical protein